MAIRLSDIQKRTRTITVRFQEEDCLVTYRINALTPAFMDALMEKRNLRDVLLLQIREVVDTWDVVDDSGKPIPPASIAEQLPTAFLQAVGNAISADMSAPGPEEKKDSGAG